LLKTTTINYFIILEQIIKNKTNISGFRIFPKNLNSTNDIIFPSQIPQKYEQFSKHFLIQIFNLKNKNESIIKLLQVGNILQFSFMIRRAGFWSK
jgi:hypothetical protein